MQVKKQEVRNRILKVAEEEFLELGYEKTSLRTIAQKAQMTKGGIYTYFKNKDALFCALVEPAMALFDRGVFDDYENMDSQTLIKETHYSHSTIEGFRRHVEVINDRRNSMMLLFFCSDGSSYSNYREEIAEKYERNSTIFYEAISENNQNFDNRVSYLFLHTLAQLYLGFIEEILLHNPKGEELERYIHEMCAFVTGGTGGIIKLHGAKGNK